MKAAQNGEGGVNEVRVQGSRGFYRLGAFAYRRRWWVVGAWLVLFALAAPLLGSLTERLSQGGWEVPDSDSSRALELAEEFTGQYEIVTTLVMRSDTMRVDDPRFVAAFEQVRDALARGPGVAEISDPYASPERSISADGRVLTAEMGISDDQDQALRHAEELNEITEEAARGTGVTAILTGEAPMYAAFSETTTHDLERAERIALPISLLILILAFGSLVAAGLPLAVALLSLVLTFGVIAIVAATTTVSIFTQNIASMIGIGVGIDYSLFVVTRFREELRLGKAPAEAVPTAVATSGKAVFVSALTVAVSLSGILLVDIAAIRSMGLGAMIAVAMAGFAGLTLLPALLSLLGPRVNRLAVRRRLVRGVAGGWWRAWAAVVMRRPWRFMLASLLIVGLLAWPALHLRLGSSGPEMLPEGAGPRVAFDITSEAFGEGAIAPVQVFVEDPRGVLDAGFGDLHRLTSELANDPEVVQVFSAATLAPGPVEQAQAVALSPEAAPAVGRLVAREGELALVTVVTRHGPARAETEDYVERLRERLPGLLPEGARAHVGGSPAFNLDINREMEGAILPVVALVLVLSYLLLLLFFRSVLLPLKAILMNAGSVLAAYGVLVFVFQDGHFEGLLGFTSAGHIESFIPLFLFCILFGLSMDYEVFLLARIREEYLRTGDNTEAVGWGLEHTGRIITSAAAIMVTVFGAFAFTSLLPIKTMGFGLAMAVFFDATLVRVVLVPSTMRLMGTWNWWLPGWLDRILPNVSLEGAPPPAGLPPQEPKVPAGV